MFNLKNTLLSWLGVTKINARIEEQENRIVQLIRTVNYLERDNVTLHRVFDE